MGSRGEGAHRPTMRGASRSARTFTGAYTDAAKEARSLLKLNKTIETDTPNKIKLFEDNRGCEKWTHTLPVCQNLTGQSTSPTTTVEIG